MKRKSDNPRRTSPTLVHFPKRVVLLGGGIDSTVVVDLLTRRGEHLTGLHYNYGQRSLMGERRAIRWLRERYGISIELRKLSTPIGRREDEYFCRNAILILAAASEYGREPTSIVTGIHSGSPYFDCTPRFLETMQFLLDGQFHGTVSLDAPLIHSTKEEIIAHALKRRIPLEKTYSCTRRPLHPCGKCPSCLDRIAYHAF